MKRRFVIDRGVLRWAGFFYCAENLTFFSITENWYFLAGNLAHKMAESAILTGDVSRLFPLPERRKGNGTNKFKPTIDS